MATFLFATTAFAAHPDLFVQDGQSLISVEDFIANEQDDISTYYGFDNFCYQGNADVVVKKMNSWSANTDYFFSGTGGGFVLKSLKINRGFITYDIEMVLEDEVVPGEFRAVLIKPCPGKKL